MKKAIAGIVAALGLAALATAQGVPAPIVPQQFFSNSGLPLTGGTVCTYLSGTSTPATTWSSYALGSANPTCVPLDTAGRAPIWLTPGLLYRFILKDSTGVTIWTQDGISVANPYSPSPFSSVGSSISPNIAGAQVCIGGAGCTPLAPLDVEGASSGNAGLIRIDDVSGNPGLSLYANSSASGTYGGNASGLVLRSGSGVSQMTLSTGNVSIQDATPSSGSTLLTLIAGAGQLSNNIFQIENNAGTPVIWADSIGSLILKQSLQADSVAPNAIQAMNGGVEGQMLIVGTAGAGSNSLRFMGESAPALSNTGQAWIYYDNTVTPPGLYISMEGGPYAAIGTGGGGGGGSFSSITTGTNTVALLMGTGGSLDVSGTGTINATSINGTTVPVNSADNQVLLTTASATGGWKSLPSCLDAGGNHLNYNTGTNEFTCGATGGTVGSVAFSGITGSGATSTNTSASMILGSGASLSFSGAGIVNANQINGASLPSNSVWKGTSSSQPTAAVYTDITSMWPGPGCSGAALLAWNGTCQTGGGGGGFWNAGAYSNIYYSAGNVTVGATGNTTGATLEVDGTSAFNGLTNYYSSGTKQMGLIVGSNLLAWQTAAGTSVLTFTTPSGSELALFHAATSITSSNGVFPSLTVSQLTGSGANTLQVTDSSGNVQFGVDHTGLTFANGGFFATGGTPAFNSNASGSQNAFMLHNGDFTIDGNGNYTAIGQMRALGHWMNNGASVPTLSCSGVSCSVSTCSSWSGTNSDTRGCVQGSGSPLNSIIVSFYSAYGSAPLCVVSPNMYTSSSTYAFSNYGTTTNQLTIQPPYGANLLYEYTYICVQ